MIDSSEYEIDKANGRLILKSTSGEAISNGYRANKVVITGGFTESVKDIEHAVCVYASQLQRSKMTQGKESTTQRDVTIKISPRTIPQEVKDILYPYRVYGRIL